MHRRYVFAQRKRCHGDFATRYHRRELLGSLTTTATIGLAGCQSVLSDSSTCGPGETAITDLTNGSGNQVSLRGTVDEQTDQPHWFILNDGTARAMIVLESPNVMSETEAPDTGTCIRVTGNVATYDGADDPDARVSYFVDEADYEVV